MMVIFCALALHSMPTGFGRHQVGKRLFVSPKGSDSGTGERNSPFGSIQLAADISGPGDTIVLLPGLYRQRVQVTRSGEPGAPIRFVAEQPGTVTISGADPLNGWESVVGSEPIYSVSWNHLFAIDTKNGKPIECHPPTDTLWGRAEQVMARGEQLMPSPSLEALRSGWQRFKVANTGAVLTAPVAHVGPRFAGAFFADTENKRLYAWLQSGDSPNRHSIEASTRGLLFGSSPTESGDVPIHDVEVDGLTFRYAATFAQRAAVWLWGSHNTVSNCVIEDMAGKGVAVNGLLEHSLIKGCGAIGGSAMGTGFSNVSDVWLENCWKPYDRNGEAGGVKIADSGPGKFDHCAFLRNGGAGLWMDIGCHDVDVKNCVSAENEQSGLFVEISERVAALDCAFVGNGVGSVGKAPGWGRAGVDIAESDSCQVARCNLIGNKEGFTIREGGPRTFRTKEGQELTLHATHISADENRFDQNREKQIMFWWDNPILGTNQYDATRPPRPFFDPYKESISFTGNLFLGAPNEFAYIGVPTRKQERHFASEAEFLEAFPSSSPNSHGHEQGWDGVPTDFHDWAASQLPQWMRPILR